MALARRNTQPPLVEPPYEMEDVPKCNKDLSGSYVTEITDRNVWLKMLSELLLVCNEASTRFEIKSKAIQDDAEGDEEKQKNIPLSLLPIHTGKALSLEYIADRLDLDDPLTGYVVRTRDEGWMQGYITITTFTTWQRWFRFDSLVDEAGVLAYESAGAGTEALHAMGMHDLDDPNNKLTGRWWHERIVDAGGTLSAALNAQVRDGDPDGEGIIWPHVAELSLLGGLGCGSFLLRLIIEELESADSPYQFIVLQATENSVPFYEQHGFVRVGAVARYFEKPDPKKKQKAKAKSKAQAPVEAGSPVHMAQTPDKPRQPKSARRKLDLSSEDKSNQSPSEKEFGEGDDDEGENGSTTQEQSNEKDGSDIEAEKEDEQEKGNDKFSTPKKKGNKRRRIQPMSPSEFPFIKGASSKFTWHKVDKHETPTLLEVAEKFHVSPFDVVFLNRRLYPELEEASKLLDGTMLRIPHYPSFFDGENAPKLPLKTIPFNETKSMVVCDGEKGGESSSRLWYTASENETPIKIANKLGIDPYDLTRMNSSTYPDLGLTSPLMRGTILRIPGRHPKPDLQFETEDLREEVEKQRLSWGWGSDDSNQEGLSEVMTYRHWAFSDDPVEYSVASYMMVRPLKKRPAKQENSSNNTSLVSLKEERLESLEFMQQQNVWQYGYILEEAKGVEGYPKQISVLLKCRGNKRWRTPENDLPAGPFYAMVPVKKRKQDKKKQQKKKKNCNDEEDENEEEEEEEGEGESGVGDDDDDDEQQKQEHDEEEDNKKLIRATVYVKNATYVGPRLTATITAPLKVQEKVEPPEKPKHARNGFIYFTRDRRAPLRAEFPKDNSQTITTKLSDEWKALPEEEKAKYNRLAEQDRKRYNREMKEYETKMREYHEKLNLTAFLPSTLAEKQKKMLINQVVRLKPKDCAEARQSFLQVVGAGGNVKKHEQLSKYHNEFANMSAGYEHQYKYFYVLTYIGDLFWCRLVPLHSVGTYTDKNNPKTFGKTKWVLVPEGVPCQEIDVSAKRCIRIKATALKRTVDANNEEWIIPEEEEAAAAQQQQNNDIDTN